jgi:hypothetical protein
MGLERPKNALIFRVGNTNKIEGPKANTTIVKLYTQDHVLVKMKKFIKSLF